MSRDPRMNKEVLRMVLQIPGWLTPHEGEFLEKAATLLKPIRGAIVEIGSYCGKSTIWLAQSGETVYAVDPHKGDVSGGKTKPTQKVFLKNLKDAGVDTRVRPIIQTSKSAAREWNKPVKFLFIDGLHDFEHASEDFSLWSPFIVGGGMIAMHDAFCGWEGAGDVAMRHIVYSKDYSEIGVVGSIIFGIKGPISIKSRIQKMCNQLVIELCSGIYKSPFIPKRIQFILVHRFLRIFLLNRFSSFG
jgi:MMP 1-O-methyltransferase